MLLLRDPAAACAYLWLADACGGALRPKLRGNAVSRPQFKLLFLKFLLNVVTAWKLLEHPEMTVSDF